MTATITDITAIRAQRSAVAAEAAAAAQKRDPLNDPKAVLIVQLVLHRMILIQERNR